MASSEVQEWHKYVFSQYGGVYCISEMMYWYGLLSVLYFTALITTTKTVKMFNQCFLQQKSIH